MKKTIKRIVLGIVGIVIALLAWGLIEPYVLDVETEVAEIPGLPAAWEGQRVGLIADWQVGMWLDNTSTVRQSVERLVAERPALVLIAGDFIYGPSDDIDEDVRDAVAFVRPLVEAGIPTYAVLGNHDYGMDKPDAPVDVIRARTLRDTLEAAGVQVLHNEAVSLTPPPSVSNPAVQEALYLVGIGARWPNEDNVDAALAQVPDGAPRFALMHNPNSFPAFPAGTAPVAVAGHTHGGQIRIPFTESWSWLSIVEQDEVHVDGWISGFGQQGNHLYVNRGIGFSVVPIRINCMPEVTLFTLRRSD
jgi:predicted MPP superfamily phosphohydrolase